MNEKTIKNHKKYINNPTNKPTNLQEYTVIKREKEDKERLLRV